MKEHCESAERVGKQDNGIGIRSGWLREEILSKAREFLKVGGSEARRELVTTALELDRLLGEGIR